MNKSRLLAIGLTLLLTGCVLHEQPRNTRFFGDYTDYEKSDFKAETWVYRHPTTRVIDYDKFFIAPVSVYDNPQKKIKPSNRSFYDDLAIDLHQQLEKVISKHYQVVSEPGPGVLNFEFAVVDIKPNVWVTNDDGNRALVTDTKRKGSQFELDCHDALSDEQIFAISTYYIGEEYKAYEYIGGIPIVRDAFDEWAQFLAKLLERAKDSRTAAAALDRAAFRPSTAAYSVDPNNKNILVYRHPQLKVTHYSKFYLARPRLEGRTNMTLEQKKEMGLQLREEAVKVFNDTSVLVNHPGPGILTIRTRIDESPDTYKFTLECLDPNQEELVFGMIQSFPRKDLSDTYRKWNEYLKERWDEAQENSKEN